MKTKYSRTLNFVTVLGMVLIGNATGIAQAPVAAFTASPLSGCTPVVVSFQDQSTGNPLSWNWNFGNGNTSTAQNPTTTFFAPGSFTVTLTVTNASGTTTLTKTQYIHAYANPAVNFSASRQSGCFPFAVQFSDLSDPGAGNTSTNWHWDFGNGTTSTQQNPTVTYTSPGSFNVTLRVTNDKGCSRTLSRSAYITVTTGVQARFTASTPAVCSAPATVQFTNNTTGPPTLSYQWLFGDGNTSTAVSPAHTYNLNGNFTATLIASSTAGCVDTFRVPVVIGGFNTNFNMPAAVCQDALFTLTNNSTPAPVSARWDFGDGNTATGINTTHRYTTPGNYAIKLYNTYSSCVDSVQKFITVNPVPVADFNAPNRTRCEPPLTVNFQESSSPDAVSWLWDFGDGVSSSLQNPSHTYTSYGSFTVRLIVTNGFGCTDTITRTDYVKVRRTTLTLPDLPLRGCLPYTHEFIPTINTLDPIATFEWDFGDGGTSTQPQPTHTYTVQGTYTVRLITTTGAGCRDTLTITNGVKVGEKPAANFSITPVPVCGTQRVYFRNESLPAGDEWLWDFGDASSDTAQNPFHRYRTAGFFPIRLIVTNSGCPDTLTRDAAVQVLPPIARFTPVPDCTDRLRFSFTDQSIGPVSWEWDFGDGSPVSTLQNPSHVFPNLTNYTVRLIVRNGSCADTLNRTIETVDEDPNFSANTLTACKTATITFTAANVDPANINRYSWDFGDGTSASSTSQTITHNYTRSGTFTVRLTTTDINGCTDISIRNNYIRVNGPVSNFSATNVAGCAGLTTTFQDLSTTDGQNAIVNWKWIFGDGTIQTYSAPPFQHTYNTPGSYSVKLIVTDAAGCMDSLTRNNLVTATDPVPQFSSADTLSCPGGTVRFSNTSTPAGFSSRWDFGDGNTSTALSPNHSYNNTGIYSVKLVIRDAYGCADSVTKTQFIRVDDPLAAFTASDTVSSCIPFEVHFTNSSTYFRSVAWSFGPGEGGSTQTNPTHYFNQPGVYPVKLVVTSPGGCKDSITRNIYLYDTAGTRLNYLPASGCSPIPASISVTTTGPINGFVWDFGDGNTATTTTPSVNYIYTGYGSFVPRLVLQDPTGCLIPLQGLDTFHVTGSKPHFGMDSSVFCDRGLVRFSDSTTSNDPVIRYHWQFGDGGTSSLQHPQHSYASPGLYNVRLIVETQNGCIDTSIRTNTVRVVQRPLIDITGDTSVCVGSSLSHRGRFLQPDTSVVSWSWSFPNGNSSYQQDPAQQPYPAAGSFQIRAIATNSTGCQDTTYHPVHVRPYPTATIPAQIAVQNGFPVPIPATFSANTTSWIWSPATGLSCTNCPNPLAGPRYETRYQVAFSDAYGCVSRASVLVQMFCKNVNLFIPNTFSPNGDGSNDVFYLRGTGLDRVKTLRIFNRWGEVVFEKRDVPINDPTAGWNGLFRGRPAVADVYVYQAEAYCENGELIKLNGNIALIL